MLLVVYLCKAGPGGDTPTFRVGMIVVDFEGWGLPQRIIKLNPSPTTWLLKKTLSYESGHGNITFLPLKVNISKNEQMYIYFLKGPCSYEKLKVIFSHKILKITVFDSCPSICGSVIWYLFFVSYQFVFHRTSIIIITL